jgi:hypothetical protein
MKNQSPIYLVLIGLSFSFLGSGCKPDPEEPFVCPEVWDFTNSQGGSCSFANSTLSLDVNDSTQLGVAMMILQDSLRGDFAIGLAFENFDSGDAGLGAFLQLLVGNGSASAPYTAKASIGNVSPAGAGIQVGAVINSSGTDPDGTAGNYFYTSISSGSLYVSRTGSVITVTSVMGGISTTQTDNFNSEACVVAIQMGSNYQTVLGHVGVRLTTFTVSGGGTEVLHDDFGCDSFR